MVVVFAYIFESSSRHVFIIFYAVSETAALTSLPAVMLPTVAQHTIRYIKSTAELDDSCDE